MDPSIHQACWLLFSGIWLGVRGRGRRAYYRLMGPINEGNTLAQ